MLCKFIVGLYYSFSFPAGFTILCRLLYLTFLKCMKKIQKIMQMYNLMTFQPGHFPEHVLPTKFFGGMKTLVLFLKNAFLGDFKKKAWKLAIYFLIQMYKSHDLVRLTCSLHWFQNIIKYFRILCLCGWVFQDCVCVCVFLLLLWEQSHPAACMLWLNNSARKG